MKKITFLISLFVVLALGVKAQDVGGVFVKPVGDTTVVIGADDSARVIIQVGLMNYGANQINEGTTINYNFGINGNYNPTPESVILPTGYDIPSGYVLTFQSQVFAFEMPAGQYQICFRTEGTSLGADPVTSNDESCFTLTVTGGGNSVDEKALSQFVAYPNPANNMINVVSPVSFETVRLFDMAGREVYSFNGTSTTHSINVASLEVGMYFLTIESNNAKTTKKISIAR